MIQIYVYSSLLSALSVVEMKPLNINGHVGEGVEIQCSDWDSLINVNYNDKYFCNSPCTEDKHIIIKAAYRKYVSKGRIQLYNVAEGFFVTFTNLQKSDSGTYYCGAEVTGLDSYIEVNLKVADAESSSPRTTPETIIFHLTPSFAVTNSSTMSSDGSDVITDTSVSYTTTTTSATQGAGSVPYLITGFIVIPTILMGLLMLMRKMRKKHLRVEGDMQESPQNPAGPDGVYQSLYPLTIDEEQVYSTLETTSRNVSSQSAVPDGVYQSLAPLTKDDDQVYDTLKPI